MRNPKVKGKIHERIIETAFHCGSRTALVTKKHGPITYDELLDASRAFSKRIPHPMRIGICIADAIDFAVAYLGTLMRDGQIVLIPVHATNRETLAILNNTDCSVLITDRTDIEDSSGQVSICPFHSADMVGTNSCHQTGESVIMIPTSGSSSDPKIVVMSHEALLWNADAHNAHLNIQPHETALIILPLTSSFAHTTQFLSQLINGGTSVVYNQVLFAKDIYPLMKQYEVQTIGCISTHLKMFVANPPSAEAVESLRVMVCAGAPTDIATIEKAQGYFRNASILRAYGLTEAGPRVTCGMRGEKMELTSSGLPLDGVEIKIVTETDVGSEAEAAGIGEIWVKSPSLFQGYYNNESKTSEGFRGGDWLRTGDFGYLDSENRLHVMGRKKNIIIVGGFNVFPEEIEDVLCCFPGIAEAYVYGASDPITGEAVHADIVLHSEQVNMGELKKHCRLNLSAYKIPVLFRVTDAIPRTHNGKIKRHAAVH